MITINSKVDFYRKSDNGGYTRTNLKPMVVKQVGTLFAYVCDSDDKHGTAGEWLPISARNAKLMLA